MTDLLLPAVLLVSILTLAVAIGSLLSSRRSEALGEERYELLRDQRDRLDLMHEERQMLIEELQREAQQRQQVMDFLAKTPSQLVQDLKKEKGERLEVQERIEGLEQERLRLEQELQQSKEQLERERRGHLESQRRVERLEQEQKQRSGIRQDVERLGQERQRLTEDLEREREERLGAQRRAEQQEQAQARREREFRRLKAELDSRRRAPTRDRVKGSEATHPWWRRPVLVGGLLFGALVAWLTSLVVALYLLSP